jgi:hypothetical protein
MDSQVPQLPFRLIIVCALRANPSGSWGRQTHLPRGKGVWFFFAIQYLPMENLTGKEKRSPTGEPSLLIP